MADSPITVHPLSVGWSALARRLSVAAGALAALLSLLARTPVWVASARGLAAFLAVVIAARLAGRLLVWLLEEEGGPPLAQG